LRLRWIYRPDGAFRPQGLELSLDGRRAYETHDTMQLQKEHVVLADMDVPPGVHRLNSLVKVSGWGEGLFAYLQDYRAQIPSEHALSVQGGDVRCVSLVAYYREGISLPVEERPAAHFVEERAPRPVQK
jgi:hypothetical protein